MQAQAQQIQIPEGMIALFFEKPFDVYRPGEIASFPETKAARLLKTRARVEGGEVPIVRIATVDEISQASTAASVAGQEQQAAIERRREPLVMVEFSSSCGRYRAGERASFPASEAIVYVAGIPGVRPGYARFTEISPEALDFIRHDSRFHGMVTRQDVATAAGTAKPARQRGAAAAGATQDEGKAPQKPAEGG